MKAENDPVDVQGSPDVENQAMLVHRGCYGRCGLIKSKIPPKPKALLLSSARIPDPTPSFCRIAQIRITPTRIDPTLASIAVETRAMGGCRSPSS